MQLRLHVEGPESYDVFAYEPLAECKNGHHCCYRVDICMLPVSDGVTIVRKR